MRDLGCPSRMARRAHPGTCTGAGRDPDRPGARSRRRPRHGVGTTKILISGMRRGITPLLAKLLKRRSAIEPEIGHMKSDGRLARCPLKGRIGDAVFAVLCACGHNMRKILAHIRALWALLLHLIAAIIWRERPLHRQALPA